MPAEAAPHSRLRAGEGSLECAQNAFQMDLFRFCASAGARKIPRSCLFSRIYSEHPDPVFSAEYTLNKPVLFFSPEIPAEVVY